MSKQITDIDKFCFKTPITACVTGPTSCGKTNFIFRVIRYKNQLFSEPVTKVIYCYKVWQSKFDIFLSQATEEEKSQTVFHEGVFDVSKHSTYEKHTLLIIDDLLHEIGKDLASVFCVDSHHKNISVFFLNQNMFLKNKYARDINLNTQYLILFKQRRDLTSVRSLAVQLFPGKTADFLGIYNESTQAPFSYLMIELHPANTHRVLLRRNIFPNEIETVYIPST